MGRGGVLQTHCGVQPLSTTLWPLSVLDALRKLCCATILGRDRLTGSAPGGDLGSSWGFSPLVSALPYAGAFIFPVPIKSAHFSPSYHLALAQPTSPVQMTTSNAPQVLTPTQSPLRLSHGSHMDSHTH